jgi:hypothetical protein
MLVALPSSCRVLVTCPNTKQPSNKPLAHDLSSCSDSLQAQQPTPDQGSGSPSAEDGLRHLLLFTPDDTLCAQLLL